jgi:hypothetical protein
MKPHLAFFRQLRKCDNRVTFREIHSQKCETRLPKSETSGTICWDRLLLNSCNLPHAYFYGNWRAKVPNILRMKEFAGKAQSGRDSAGLTGRD